MTVHGLTRYIEDLIRSRRPRRFKASEDDAAMIRAAITLRAARPGSGEPTDEFVSSLHKKLAAELDPPPVRRAAGARRTFLRAAAAAGGAAAAVAAGAGIDHAVTSRTAPEPAPVPAGTLTPSHGIWLTVAHSADLPDGAVRPFTVSAVTGFIERADGQLRAVSGVCTHQGCRLALAARPARLVCPCHGATFALDGTVLAHKFPIPLAALPRVEVREVGGVVQVYAPLADL
jgi:nitrite reductase/ring-hydroxylating ferredoxin subunit